MASTYPTTLDTLATNKVDGTATVTDHAAHHDDMADAINKIEAELGTLPKGNFASVKAAISAAMPIGTVVDFAGPAANIPTGWLACFGQSVLRTTYALLLQALAAAKGTVTVTLASPGVWTSVGHGLVVGDLVVITTSGALPTGVSANTNYYVMTVPTADTFTLGTTRSVSATTGLATVTTAVNTSGTQSGTHSLTLVPYGVADATHFNLPDFRGAHGVGLDNMGGADAGNLNSASNVTGTAWGEDTHALLATESGLPSHTHADTFAVVANDVPGLFTNTAPSSGTGNGAMLAGADSGRVSHQIETSSHTHTVSGAVSAVGAVNAALVHNNMPPLVQVNKIIFAGV